MTNLPTCKVGAISATGSSSPRPWTPCSSSRGTAQTFRWYAGRAEVVCRKDIPQDAGGIVQWWRRMNDLYRDRHVPNSLAWYRSLSDLGPSKLVQLGEKYGASMC